MIGYIYKISTPDDKIYIGQTINLEDRKKRYRNGGCKGQILIHRYIKKYGWDNLIFEVIEITEINSLNDREIFWIDYYKSNYNRYKLNGLNLTDGGEGARGHTTSESTKEKLRQHRLGKKLSDETKAKIRATILETKAKLRQHHLGKKISDETKAKISKANKGKKHTDETKAKISTSLRGRVIKHNSETKNKMSVVKMKKIKCLENQIIYNSISEAAKELNVAQPNISRVLHGVVKTAGGFHFEFVEK